MIEPFVSGIRTVELPLNEEITGYAIWKDLPLFIMVFITGFYVLSLGKNID